MSLPIQLGGTAGMASLLTLVISALAPSAIAQEPANPLGFRVGDIYEITLIRESSEKTGDDSSSSSYDKDTLVERVIDVRADGIEFEYDLPADSEDRSSTWQFPARVLEDASGQLRLVNRPELESRLNAWLKAAKWTRDVCGHWIFTWNAFRIECDPDSAIRSIKALDLRSAEMREGTPYREAIARTAGTLIAGPTAGRHPTLVAAMEVDPDAVRRARANSSVAVGEIMRKPVTFEEALLEQSKDAIRGNISVKFEMDADGIPWRRTTVTKIETKKPNGGSETQTVTEWLERKRISPR